MPCLCPGSRASVRQMSTKTQMGRQSKGLHQPGSFSATWQIGSSPPQHATGQVTPQFHVVLDDFCDTTRNHSHVRLPVSLWQRKTHFQAPISQSLMHDIKCNYLHAPPCSNTESVPIEEPIVNPNHNPTQQHATTPQPTMIKQTVALAPQPTSTTRSLPTVRPP